MRIRFRSVNPSLATLTAAVLLAALVSACAKTVQEQPEMAKQMEKGEPAPAYAGSFFGNDLPLLQPGKEGQAAMVYVNPSVQWSKYNKILIEPVEFWDSENSTVSPSDQHMLTAYFYNKLKEDLQKNFTLVDQGGPGVLDLKVAMVSTTTATPVLRSVSVVVPQVRILNSLQSLATGSYAFVGSAQAMMKAVDSESGKMLAGAIDQRKGGIALSTAAQWKWGDAENAMDYWSERIDTRLLEVQGRQPASA